MESAPTLTPMTPMGSTPKRKFKPKVRLIKSFDTSRPSLHPSRDYNRTPEEVVAERGVEHSSSGGGPMLGSGKLAFRNIDKEFPVFDLSETLEKDLEMSLSLEGNAPLKNHKRNRLKTEIAEPTRKFLGKADFGMVDLDRNASWSLKDGIFKGGGVEVSPTFLDHTTGKHVSDKDIIRLWTLGKGQNRSVWAGIHLPTFKLVAIKTADLENTSSRHQFTNELKVLSRMRHPNILAFHGAHLAGNDVSAVLELMVGGSVEQYIKRFGALDEGYIASVAYAALNGLSHMHKALIIHGDIKPANILMNETTAKLIDFGLSSSVAYPGVSTKSESGTMLYMAPEQHMWKQKSPASDIWSFGLTLIYLATAQPPYDAKGYWELLETIIDTDGPPLPKGISATFKNFLQKCIKKSPRDRASAEELLRHPFLELRRTGCIGQMAERNRDPSIVPEIFERLHRGISLLKEEEAIVTGEGDDEADGFVVVDNKAQSHKSSYFPRSDSFIEALRTALTHALAKVETKLFGKDLSEVIDVHDISEEHLRNLTEQLCLPWDPKFMDVWNNLLEKSPQRENSGSDGKEKSGEEKNASEETSNSTKIYTRSEIESITPTDCSNCNKSEDTKIECTENENLQRNEEDKKDTKCKEEGKVYKNFGLSGGQREDVRCSCLFNFPSLLKKCRSSFEF